MSDWLNISLPQWQGSGASQDILTGNRVLIDYLKLKNLLEIPISSVISDTENKIFSYASILNNMHSVHNMLKSKNPIKICTIGGDCGIEPIPVSYLNSHSKNFGLIWIDAHGDLNTPESSPSSHFHGMPLRLILGDGYYEMKHEMFSFLRPEQVFLIGARDLDEAEADYIEDKKLYLDTELSYKRLSKRLHKHGISNLYIHLDVDVIEPSEFSHVKCPTKGGASVKDLLNFLTLIYDNFQVVGKSITEVTATREEYITPLERLLSSFFRDNS